MSKKIFWEQFFDGVLRGEFIYNFRYKDKFIFIGTEIKGIFAKTKYWVFALHKHNNTGNEIYSLYKTPELLLDNVRIDGKTLQEIWNDVEFE